MKETKNNVTIHPIPRGVWESSVPGEEEKESRETGERGMQTTSEETNGQSAQVEKEGLLVGPKTVQAGITVDLQGNGYPDPGKMLSESIEER